MRTAALTVPTIPVLLLLQASPAVSQQTTAELVEVATPAVVMISVATADGGKSGSGFVVDPAGIIMTNHHVISNGTSAAVKLPSGDVFDEVQILAEDERRDIAILRVAGFGLPTLPLGNSDSVRIGSDVVAIGSPLGLENTVSTGIVSGFRQYEGYRLMQISAPISHGSSGGAILDESGSVIALAVAGIEEGQNLNFAVPVNYARGLLATVGEAPTERLARMSDPEIGSYATSPKQVNVGLPAVSEFRDFAYEYETDLGNGYKLKGELHFERIQLSGDSVELVEISDESRTEYKSAPLASSQKVATSQTRVLARLGDLTPIEAYVYKSAWDGSRWRNASRELQFGAGRVRGFTVDDGTRTEHDLEVAPGTRISLALSIGALAADSVIGKTYELTMFDVEGLVARTVLAKFEGLDELDEAGRDFTVVKVEMTSGPQRAEYFYSAYFPPYLVRSETASGKGRIKKVIK